MCRAKGYEGKITNLKKNRQMLYPGSSLCPYVAFLKDCLFSVRPVACNQHPTQERFEVKMKNNTTTTTCLHVGLKNYILPE